MARLITLFLVILLLVLEVVIAKLGHTKIDVEEINFKRRFDVCRLPMERGKCRHGVTSWYYNHTLKECKRFIYSLCGGNLNRFYKKQECEDYCKLMQ